MKLPARFLLVATVGLLLGSNASAAPMMAVGDNAELFITASANVNRDDNIYLRHTNVASDTIWSFQPGLQLAFGQKAATNGQVYFQENFLKYTSHSIQDTNLANVGFQSNYNDGKSQLNLAASYQELAQNDTTAPGDIVSRDVTNLKAAGETAVSEKTSIGAGILYDKTNYGPASYVDESDWSVPLDAYFEISPKLQASVGYRYRDTTLSNGYPDSKDHFFNIGARGEFTPKLTGQLRVGYGVRTFSVGSNQTEMGIDSGFTYAYSEKTTVTFGLTNDFGDSAFGQSTKNRTFSLGAISKIDEQWAWNLRLAQMSIDYPAGRAAGFGATTDNYVEGSLGCTYVYNNNLNFAASYTHRNNSSDLTALNFSNNVFNVGANIRY
ncbi:MAG: outer membrane beta-barrel protein [Opitutales bacterium]